MALQIGLFAYKQKGTYAKTFPLLAKETEELKQAKENLFATACDIFITDLLNYCTTASVFRAEKVACKKNKIKDG